MLSDYDKKFLQGMNIKADRDIAVERPCSTCTPRPARRTPESLLHDPRIGPDRGIGKNPAAEEYLRLLQDCRETGLDYMVTLPSGERISAYQLSLRMGIDAEFVCGNGRCPVCKALDEPAPDPSVRQPGRAYSGSDDQKIYNLATHNGCSPFWADGMLGWAWHCGCTDDLHCSDQQCSAITFKSARNRRSK